MRILQYIPGGFQKSGNSEAGARDFNQALAGGEAGHVVHMADAAGLKDLDAGAGSDQFLKHERYIHPFHNLEKTPIINAHVALSALKQAIAISTTINTTGALILESRT